MPSCDIIIVTCRRDLTWAYLCLRLLLKYWQSPGSIIVRLEEDCREDIQNWNLGPRVIFRYVRRSWADGYCFQMYQKMISDDYSPADLLMLIDSDCMLLDYASLDLLMHDGKPIIEYCPWHLGDPVAERVWRGPTSRMMGTDLHADFMVQHPFLFWRSTFSGVRQRIVNVTGQGFYDALYSDVPFHPSNFLNHPMKIADFECLNLYGATFENDRYFVRLNSDRPPDWPFRLYWSHGDWSPQVEAFLTSKL